jgi:hypothetical protein
MIVIVETNFILEFVLQQEQSELRDLGCAYIQSFEDAVARIKSNASR